LVLDEQNIYENLSVSFRSIRLQTPSPHESGQYPEKQKRDFDSQGIFLMNNPSIGSTNKLKAAAGESDQVKLLTPLGGGILLCW